MALRVVRNSVSVEANPDAPIFRQGQRINCICKSREHLLKAAATITHQAFNWIIPKTRSKPERTVRRRQGRASRPSPNTAGRVLLYHSVGHVKVSEVARVITRDAGGSRAEP